MSNIEYVAAIGNISADSYYRCLQNIVAGDKFFVRFEETLPGGMVANAACVMAKLGTPVLMFSALGEDEDTALLRNSFAQYSVDIRFCIRWQIVIICVHQFYYIRMTVNVQSYFMKPRQTGSCPKRKGTRSTWKCFIHLRVDVRF